MRNKGKFGIIALLLKMREEQGEGREREVMFVLDCVSVNVFRFVSM